MQLKIKDDDDIKPCENKIGSFEGCYPIYMYGLTFFGTIIDIDTTNIGGLQPNPPLFSADELARLWFYARCKPPKFENPRPLNRFETDRLDSEFKFVTLQKWVVQEYGSKMYIGAYNRNGYSYTAYLAIALPSSQSMTTLTEFFQKIRNGNILKEYYNLLELLEQEIKEPELQTYVCQSDSLNGLNIVPDVFKCKCDYCR